LLVKLGKLEVGAAQAEKLDVVLLKLGELKDLLKLEVMLSNLASWKSCCSAMNDLSHAAQP
jgi:hypothetical protein